MFYKQTARWWGILIILLLGSVFLPVYGAPKVQAASKTSNKIFVHLKSKAKSSAILSVTSTLQNANLLGGLPVSDVLVFKDNGDMGKALSELRANPNVASADQVSSFHALMGANDTNYNKEWALVNMKVGGTGNSAWDNIVSVDTKTQAIKVAVIDSGIDNTHEDLRDKITSVDMKTCKYDTGDVQTDCKSGGVDDYGHGSHVAGIIAASTNNSLGIAGVGWGAKLMSLKVLDNTGGGYTDDMITAIDYAADNGANVINMSFGAAESLLSASDITEINAATTYAWENGVVIVAAAGNCGDSSAIGLAECDNQVNPVLYPAHSDHVISVAAMGPDDTLAPYSEFGDWVSVAAPGGSCVGGLASNCSILSTMSNTLCTSMHGLQGPTNYCYLEGTSMASPNVAGVVALMLAKNPNLTPDQVRDLLQNNADKTKPVGNTAATHFGAVNALEAVVGITAATLAPTHTPGPTHTPAPTNTPAPPTLTPTPSLYPTTGVARLPRIPPNPYPAPPFCPSTVSCSNKIVGDANCTGVVDFADYGFWLTQFDTFPPAIPNNSNANFSCVEGNSTTYFVDMPDFEVWRRNTTDLGNITPTITPGSPTLTPTPGVSNTPVPPTDTPPVLTDTPPVPTDTPVPTNPPPEGECPNPDNLCTVACISVNGAPWTSEAGITVRYGDVLTLNVAPHAGRTVFLKNINDLVGNQCSDLLTATCPQITNVIDSFYPVGPATVYAFRHSDLFWQDDGTGCHNFMYVNITDQ